MSLDKDQAIAAALAFTASRTPNSSRRVLRVDRGNVGGEDCWLVLTDTAPRPDEPDWFFEVDSEETLFISVATGRCIGFQGMRGREIFDPPSSPG
jgi:hypothetical protein